MYAAHLWNTKKIWRRSERSETTCSITPPVFRGHQQWTPVRILTGELAIAADNDTL